MGGVSMEWKEVRLGDVCSRVCSGGTPKSTNLSYYGGEIPWLNTKEIDFNRIYSTEKTITDSGLNNSSAKWIVPNTVTVAMYGATAGKSCIVKVPMTTNQACCNLTINDEVADYEFVYYTLKNDYTTLASLANGGAQQNLNAQIIKDYVLKMPSLADQRRIASILSSLDRKIELNNKINADLEEMAQAIFKNWFVDFEPFKDGKFVDSELGMIPEGWKVGTLDEIFSLKYGKNLSTSMILEKGDYPVYGANGIIGYYNEYNCDKYSVLVTSRGNGSGDVSRTHHPKSFITNNSFIVEPLEQYKYIELPFINGLFNIIDFKSYCSGSAQPQLTNKAMRNICIISPPMEIVIKYCEMLETLFSHIECVIAENSRLSLLRDTLLPRLMSGELEVPE